MPMSRNRIDEGVADAFVGRPHISARTTLGTLVAGEVGDTNTPGIEIDLVRGTRLRQVALVDAEPTNPGLPDELRAMVWDDLHSEVPSYDEPVEGGTLEVEPNAPWYETRLEGASPTEDKAGFLATLCSALATSEPLRYGYLAERPLVYLASPSGSLEFVSDGTIAINVTGDSLTALGTEALRLVAGSETRGPRVVSDGHARALVGKSRHRERHE